MEKIQKKKTLNDIWRYDTWSFSNADAKNGYQTKQRYNHSIIIIGGRGYSNGNNNQILIEVFNTLNNEGYSLCGINMNRQTSFIYQKKYLFIWRIWSKKSKETFRRFISNFT